MKPLSVLIPAYNPNEILLDLVNGLVSSDIENIIIVNDGSESICTPIFDNLKTLSQKVIVLEHATNLGKGSALKTGLNFIYTHYVNNIGVVTADADGQHLVKDILTIAQTLIDHPQDLIIGRREFITNGTKIPFRSRFGNILTKTIFKFIIGRDVSDTQSGLRGIPINFIPTILTINNNGYEFELNMLIACKYTNRNIFEQPITTVYIDNNKSSHFNPLLDSLKIYLVLFRFTLLSLFTYLIDFTTFMILMHYNFSILTGQIGGRLASISFNYPLAKKMVFHCDTDNNYPFFKYLLLVIANLAVSYTLIMVLVDDYAVPAWLAKILVESLIFFANFAIEREFIFTKKITYEN